MRPFAPSAWTLPVLLAAAACSSGEDASRPAGEGPREWPTVSVQEVEVDLAKCDWAERLFVVDRFFIGGQVTSDELIKGALPAKVRSVIDLREPGEYKQMTEPLVVKAVSMFYLNAWFTSPDELTDEIFDEVRRRLRARKGPAIIHSGAGNRVGPLWIAMRVLDMEIDFDTAVAEARAIGMHDDVYIAVARDYIDRHPKMIKRLAENPEGS